MLMASKIIILVSGRQLVFESLNYSKFCVSQKSLYNYDATI